ncbi:MerC domain-containing protein [Aquimarina sp. ERC-38]|uniref:MerC domain-containing protein n=1 Tax=Aquimarina sp. ERC-38 TaxID=2949996 RepID=UPI0022482551|nr:MerC domain-containing protein [Aquimarina sp. ERC-38]UZO79144.1 MerC domain-containing protein [Aquimarina sp. ERC-38]
MIAIIKKTKYPNLLGVTASGLCLIHCLITPLFFSLQASTFGLRKEHLLWWQLLDLVFLVISLIAIIVSTTQTSKSWIKYALWSSWIILAGIILNEKFGILEIKEVVIYVPSIALILLHFYNRKYCQCTGTDCCTNSSSV